MAGNSMPNMATLTRQYFGNNIVRSSAQDPAQAIITLLGTLSTETPEARVLAATPQVTQQDTLNVLGNLQAWAPGSVIGTQGTIGGGPLNVVPRSKAVDSQARSGRGPMQPGVSFIAP